MLVDRRDIAAVFAGGALGTLARAEVAVWIPPLPGHWPWATLAVNLVGAFILGVVVVRFAGTNRPSDVRLRFLRPGLCSGLTTFSTVQLELLRMLDADRPGLTLAYAAVSLVGGLLALQLATGLARRRPRSG